MREASPYRFWVRSIFTLFLVVLFAGILFGQINGPRPSVTSLGGQFTIFNPPGPRASVTSLGPNGWTPGPCCLIRPVRPAPGFTFHHHHHPGDGANLRGVYGGYPIVAMPYYYPADVIDPVDDSMEQTYAPGPTIFDRNGSRRADRDDAYNASAYAQQLDSRLGRLEQQLEEVEQAKPGALSAQAEPPIPTRDQPETILVFRDGHTQKVKNYAIVGNTLYDYSTGTRHKIDLGDLDVSATQKQNDDRGVDFRLPHGAGN